MQRMKKMSMSTTNTPEKCNMDDIPEITQMAFEREQEIPIPWSASGSDLSFNAISSDIAQAERGVNLRVGGH